MAGNKKRNTAYRKEENTFTGGGNAAYQPRDANTGKPGRGSDGKRQAEKSMRAHQETFRQKVQKSGSGQSQGNSTFSEHKSSVPHRTCRP